MKRALPALLALTLIAPTAGAQPGTRTLTLWHAYSGAEEQAVVASARAFEEANPGVRVEILANAFGAYASKLESAIPTGRGPDVFIDAHERLPSYLERHLVLAMQGEYAPHFEAAHLDSLRAEGALYGIPLATKAVALYLNDDCYPGWQQPESLDEIAVARPPDPATTPNGECEYGLVFEAENAYYVAGLVHAEGGALLTDEGDYGFDSPAAARAVSTLKGWLDAGAIPEEANGELVGRLFRTGRASAAISGPWLAASLEGVSYQVVPVPPVAAGAWQPYATVEAAFVAAETEQRLLAESFARFLAIDAATTRARVGRQVVAATAAWDAPALASDTFLTTFRRAAQDAVPMPTHPNMRQVFEPAQRALRAVLRGGQPVEDALAQGRADFDDATRPMPAPRSPTPTLLVLGLLLLVVVGRWAMRLRDPETRAAIRASMPAYRYLWHAFLAVGLLVVLPLLVGAAASLFAGRGTDMHFVGAANYVDILTARGGELLGQRSFYLVLLVTVLWTVCNLALHLGIGMALALVLQRPTLKLRGLYRVLLILPWAVPSYVTALAWKGMFHRQLGAINAVLEALGGEPVSWFGQFTTAFAANLATNVWLGFPFMMVVTLGALTSIPKDLYEAADVDGATRWQRFTRVTLPMLRPALAPAVAMGAVWTFNMFNVVFLVSGGEPGGSTEILVSEAYRWAFTRGSQYGYAAAYAVLIFALLFVTTRLFGARAARTPARSPA